MIVKTEAARPDKPEILIVEDDPGVRRSLQMLLQGQGFAVRAFASAEALADHEASCSADCLIADYILSALDGISLLTQLRAKGWQGPALLVTAFPSAELMHRAISSGYTAVFEKPLRERSLTEAVWRLVTPAPADDPASGADAGK